MKQQLDAARRDFWNRPADPPNHSNAVLLSLCDADYRIWPGYYEDEEWRLAEGNTCDCIIGWMELNKAAKILGDTYVGFPQV